MMEVVATGERAGGGQHPFQRRNVQEWSRLDELTGMLEHARVETDHWAASTSNSSHHFGKVVNSRSRNLADGGLEQRQQTKQLEVFQANIPGGSLQVIRSQSVTSTSSSWHGQHKISNSRWNSNSNEVPALPSVQKKEFDNLKLALNPLDLSSQKTKASVGRSGSIGSRRPPSRPRSIVSLKHDDIISEDKEANRLSELSRINHQIHQEAKEKLFSNLATASTHRLLSNGLSKTKHDYDENDTNDYPYSLEGRYNLRNSSVHEIAKSSSESTISSSHQSLTRKKSCSSEDLHHNEEDRKPEDIGIDKPEWNRSSKVRRSLQFPLKPNAIHKDIPVVPLAKSVSQIKEEIEARKQIVSSVLKGNQWNNLGELEGVLGVVTNGHDVEPILPSTPTKKRQSFITVESLKEVRGRLRKLNSPTDDAVRSEETDDGIVTEVKSDSPVLDKMDDVPRNSVKSYVFGMEAVLRTGKQPVVGTGSLESRSSNKTNGNGNSRTEEWYNRRKSYGFEQVNGQQSNQSSMSIEKSKVDSSTDSGICRSSETMSFPSWVKPVDRITDDGNKLKTCHNIVIKHSEDENEQNNSKEKLSKSEIESGTLIPTGRKTVVTLGTSNYSQSNWNWNSNKEEAHSHDVKKETVTKGKIADALRKLREKSTSFESHRLSEPITISIPIQQSHSQITDPKLLLLKQTKETSEQPDVTPSPTLKGQNVTSYSHLLYGHNVNHTEKELNKDKIQENSDILSRQTNRTKTLSNWFDSELKRHSIAVDEAKYITNRNKPYSSYYLQEGPDRKISLPTNNHLKDGSALVNNTTAHVFLNPSDRDANKYSGESDYEINTHEKKQKKVEFCKTEVHFAAEPGRFNIVETDGKPPPSNMYRRRKKTTSSETTNRSGLPEIRFGDSQYEKNLLTGSENNEFDSDPKIKPLTFRGSPAFQDVEKEDNVLFAQSNTTTSSCTYLSDSSQEEQKTTEPQIYSEDETPRPRSILKNNIPKPRPFLLGENNSEEAVWDVKLKSVNETEQVNEVLINDNEDINNITKETEFQKLLRSLRPATQKSSDFVRSPIETSSIAADNGLEVRISSSTILPDQRRASWSVADRIRHVEDLRTKGYLTKVNFGIGEAVVIGSETEEQPRISHYEPGEQLPNNWFQREQHYSIDAVLPTASHRVLTYAPQASHVQGKETLVNNRPKVTSISLNYDKAMTPQPVSVYSQSTQQNSNTVKNTSNLEIVGNVEQSENGTRIWSFSKSTSSNIERKSPTNIINENYISQKSDNKHTSSALKTDLLDETDNIELRSSHLLNRKSHSPSKDVLFVQKTEEQKMKHNENSRHRSLSPNIILNTRAQKKFNEDSAEKTSQTEPEYVNIKKDVKATQTSYRQISSSQSSNKNTRDKVKKDGIKTNEVNKNISDSKRKERKLSTSSSGRDGWLNTPKEPQARHKSDIPFRKVDIRKESHSNTNISKSSAVKRNQHGSESPIYQNREVYASKKEAVDRSETESAILEELTKAADQILLAVNGYTDDDSFRGSSDDEYRKRHGREKIVSKPLCTISETPSKKVINTNYRRTSHITTQRASRTGEVNKEQRIMTKPRLGKTSSNSSMDSGPTEVKPLLTPEDRSKRRAARLLQRANSRELLLQTAASSSEDIGSGSEAGNVRAKQRIVRRTRAQGTRSSTSTQQTAISHRSTTSASESRTRDRVQRTTTNSDKASSKKQVVSKRTKADEKLPNHSRPVTSSIGPVKCERAERRSLAMSSSLQPSNVLRQKKSYTSHSEESAKSRE